MSNYIYLFISLYYVLGFAVTTCTTDWWLRNLFTLSHFWRPNWNLKCYASHAPSGALRKNHCHQLLYFGRWILGMLWLGPALLQSLPLSSLGLVSLSLCLHFPLRLRPPVTGLYSYESSMTSFNLIIFCRPIVCWYRKVPSPRPPLHTQSRVNHRAPKLVIGLL